jgi:hypothetical protein
LQRRNDTTGPSVDPLTDPVGWMAQVDAEAADAELDELVAMANAPVEKEIDVLAQSETWLKPGPPKRKSPPTP